LLIAPATYCTNVWIKAITD